jgi:tRNA(fMet)-specific endonuclease VapC
MSPSILDTDSVSEYLRKNQNVVNKVEQYIQAFGRINLGIITYYEIMNGLKYKDAKNQLSRF